MDEQIRGMADSPGGRRRYSTLGLALALAAGLLVGAAAVQMLSGTGSAVDGEVPIDDHASDLPPGVVEISADAQRNSGMQVAAVGLRPLPTTLQLTGVVSPVESRVAHVRPLARGVAEQVSVTLGQRVRQGDPLVTIDNIELGERVGEFLTESAAVQQAGSDLTVRQKALERAEALIKLEGISQQELDLRVAEFRNAQAAVTSQRARLARVEEQLHRFGLSDADLAALGGTHETSGHRVASHNILRAPFAGVIVRYNVAPGELVGPDDELFTITDLSEVWVLADVYEKDIAELGTGRDCAIAVDAYPERPFTGRLTYVSDLINPQTRTATVRCVVDNRDGALKLDMFARVEVPTGDERPALLVPVDAVQQIDGQSVVFVRQTPTQFERRDVVTGATAGQFVEVVSGLESGLEVVSSGSFYLKTALLQDRIGDEH